jgi:hypothetical protein
MAKKPVSNVSQVAYMVANASAMVHAPGVRTADILLVPGQTTVLITDPLYLAAPNYFSPLQLESPY